MKKFLLVMTVAVMASFSSAVTLGWSGTNSDTSWVGSMKSGSLVYSASGDLAGAVAYAKEGGAGGSDYSTIDLKVKPASSKLLGGTATSTSPAATSGKYWIILFDAAMGTYAAMEMDAAAIQSMWTEAGTGPNVYEGEFTGTAVVPEPTILALLALGIAGVALRRRAQ